MSATDAVSAAQSDPVVAWVTGYHRDPQDRLWALMHGHGHVVGPWQYCGGDVWVTEGTTCRHCGLPAFYGRRRKPGPHAASALALWGPALTTPCPGPQSGERDAAL